MKSISAPFQIVLKLLFKWWWLILICVALGGGVGYFIRTKQPDIYYAQAGIWFGNNIGAVNQAQGGMSFNDLRDLITIYSALSRQPQILQPVIDQLNLGISVDQLNNLIAIQEDQQLPVLNVIVGDTDPVKAATIANSIATQIISVGDNNSKSPEAAFRQEQLHNLQLQITQLQADYDATLAKGGTLTSAVDIAQNQAELERISATLTSTRTLYAGLSASATGNGTEMHIFYSADAANAIQVTNSFLNVILSGVAGLVLALATIILIAFFDDRIQWQENLEEVSGVKVLGPLGIVPSGKLPLYVVTIPTSIESEVMRQLRAKLVLAAGDVPPKVITVTSYDSGDGKTVTSSNLAMVWAQSGLRTLLIDGDMRKGNLHENFHLPNIMGLSDILAGRDDLQVLLSRSLLESGYDNLTILPAGRSTADPASLLSKSRFADLVAMLKGQFDVIVMDSVPSIGGPDSAFMAEVSDGVLIVIHAQRTTYKAFQRTLQTLSQGKDINIYGMVFNRIALQVTSTYNQPYYRRTLAVNPEQLSRELLTAGQGRNRFNLKKNVTVDRKSGIRMYSVAATAVQLGVSEQTINEWVKMGYLKIERRGRSRWILETEMNALIEKLPRHSATYVRPEVNGSSSLSPLTQESTPNRSKSKVSTGKIADQLRGQREALLAASLREPAPDDKTDE